MLLHVIQFVLGIGLFWLLNWIGERSAVYGYMNLSTLFAQDEAPAFNFLLRTISPSVFIIVASMMLYSLGLDRLVLGIWRVSIVSYGLRLGYVLVMDRIRVINLTQFATQTIVGIGLSFLAYEKLILPKSPLFPSAASIAEELWIAIAIFIYTVFNNVKLSGAGPEKRRKRYLIYWVNRTRERFSRLVDGKLDSRLLELAAYAIIIHENFNRPPFARWLERVLPFGRHRTVGIMQVASPASLSDEESVQRGVGLLNRFRSEVLEEHGASTTNEWFRVDRAIAKYNRDDSYVFAVQELMRTLALQVMPEYRVDFESAYQGE